MNFLPNRQQFFSYGSFAYHAKKLSYAFFDDQGTITVGYLLSPVVMRRVDTRPQVMLKKAIYAQFGISCLKFNY